MKGAEQMKISAESLAKDILTLSRNSLMVNFRFLDRAISRLELVSDKNVSLATDGEKLYYGPKYVLIRYREEQSVMTRDMFHALLHCVFRHNFVGRDIDRRRWDLACDIAVENALNELESPALRTRRETLQGATVALLKNDMESLTAERIYKWLGDRGFSDEELEAERENFFADGHGIWYGAFDSNAKTDKNIDLKKIWEDVSKRMQTELETMHRESGALVQNLRALNRARYDYGEFLRRFGVQGEVMRLSDEEFDNNYYTYGLELYGNIPLVEPLEYTDRRRIRDFVIAIDTSGSVKGEVVQSFIQHTHDLMAARDSFFDRMNLHIIQCDDEVREDVRLTSKEEFDRYLGTMEIKGLGRTDFRPLFAYVDGLIHKKELNNLQGLLYFTDGKGEFPSQDPGYPTAFILNCGDDAELEVPVWAMHIALREEDILDRRL
ncbi:MAG: VWA-like domain-containing protein [Bacillota bacterium]|nr:VWA-like domain-containing protein [Bacillota bacterium]